MSARGGLWRVPMRDRRNSFQLHAYFTEKALFCSNCRRASLHRSDGRVEITLCVCFLSCLRWMLRPPLPSWQALAEPEIECNLIMMFLIIWHTDGEECTEGEWMLVPQIFLFGWVARSSKVVKVGKVFVLFFLWRMPAIGIECTKIRWLYSSRILKSPSAQVALGQSNGLVSKLETSSLWCILMICAEICWLFPYLGTKIRTEVSKIWKNLLVHPFIDAGYASIPHTEGAEARLHNYTCWYNGLITYKCFQLHDGSLART